MLVTAFLHCLYNVHVPNLLIQEHLNSLETHARSVQIDMLPGSTSNHTTAVCQAFLSMIRD